MQTIYWTDFYALGLVGKLERSTIRLPWSTGDSVAPAGQNNEKTTETKFVLEPGDTSHVFRPPHLDVWAHTNCMDAAAILPNVRMDSWRNSQPHEW